MTARRVALFGFVCALLAVGVWLAWPAGGPPRTAARDTSESRASAAPAPPLAGARDVSLAAPDESATKTEARAPAEPVRKTPSGVFIVRGRVYDAASGEPWFDATIEARYPGGEAFLETASDEAGLYRLEIEGAPPPLLELCAKVEDRSAVLATALVTDDGASELVVDFAIPGAFVVSGQVTDARTGAPIPGAEIKVFAAGAAFAEGWNDGFSDAHGRFHIDELEDLPRTRLEVVVRAEEYQPAHVANLAVADGSDTLRVDVQLTAPLVVRGRVLSRATGAPIGDARIETWSRVDEFADAGEEARSAIDGTFELPLGEIAPADVLIFVQAKGFESARSAPQSWEQPLEIRLFAAKTLTGRVLDAATGTPIGDVELELVPAGVPSSFASDYGDATAVRADGTFELAVENVPTGPAKLTATAWGFVPRTWDVVVPVEPEHGGGLELELERELLVRGRVTRRADGEPVSGARLRTMLPGSREQASPTAETDKDGSYELHLPAAAAHAARWVVEYQGERRALAVLAIPADANGELVRDFTLDLPAPRARIAPVEPAESDAGKR
jgi:protocatechuate 3,4-dioxygenase beta subunit